MHVTFSAKNPFRKCKSCQATGIKSINIVVRSFICQFLPEYLRCFFICWNSWFGSSNDLSAALAFPRMNVQQRFRYVHCYFECKGSILNDEIQILYISITIMNQPTLEIVFEVFFIVISLCLISNIWTVNFRYILSSVIKNLI